MVSQFIGLLLVGLGLKTPGYTQPDVKGDSIEVSATVTPAPATGTTYTTTTKGKNTDTRPRILPVLNKTVKEVEDDRVASRPGDPKEKNRTEELKQLREHMVQNRQDFMEEMKTKRAEAQEAFKTKQEAFKQKVAEIKDERKKYLVDKLNTRCQEINKKRTDAMTGMLTKLSSILENVTNRATTAKANGKDTSSVDAAISTAQTAITTAQTAVAAQAGTECVITINSENTLRADTGAAISGLEKQLKTVYDAVLAARKAVGDAIKALGVVLGESLTAKPTPTATVTSTP